MTKIEREAPRLITSTTFFLHSIYEYTPFPYIVTYTLQGLQDTCPSQLDLSSMDIASESAFNPISRAATPKPAEPGTANASAGGPSSHGNVVKDGSQGTSDDSAVSNSASADASTNGATLEAEVGQVVQQLSSWGGSLWGGFRKQVWRVDAWHRPA
jgi:hypothetical protein